MNLGSNKMLTLAKNWWLLVVRGLIAILLAGLAFAWPGITLTALVFLFGGYARCDDDLAERGGCQPDGRRCPGQRVHYD